MPSSVAVRDQQVYVSETAGVASIVVQRVGDTTLPVTVTYGITPATALAGPDFIGTGGTVLIPAGASSVTVPITIVDDAIGEPTEDFVFSIISVTNSTLLAPRTSRISILDNETPAPPPESEPPLVSPYLITQTPVVAGLVQPSAWSFPR